VRGVSVEMTNWKNRCDSCVREGWGEGEFFEMMKQKHQQAHTSEFINAIRDIGRG